MWLERAEPGRLVAVSVFRRGGVAGDAQRARRDPPGAAGRCARGAAALLSPSHSATMLTGEKVDLGVGRAAREAVGADEHAVEVG